VVLKLIAEAPPTAQTIHAFSESRISNLVTAYQALHLRFDSLALLAEGLIDHYGKQGELIVYDLMTETRLAAVKGNTGSVKVFLDDFASTPEIPTLFTAGLDMEVISRSAAEAVVHVHGCEWARYFRERHPRVGYLIACSTDEVAYRTFNSHLRLQRTQTIMEGAPLCDFRVYALDE